jgi:HAD superfamily hydrolase (TIGR01509 family)
MRRILLWDVMGTLVHDPFFAEMPSFFNMSFESLLEAKHPRAWVQFELGELSEDEFLRRFFADERDFDREGFVDAVRASYRWLPGLEALLAELQARGFEMHAFSNYPIWYRLIEERLGLSRFLDWTFVSCVTKVRKPNTEAYSRVLHELAVPAERCLFIDDRAGNVEVAREQGMDALVFDGVGSLRASLENAGLL